MSTDKPETTSRIHSVSLAVLATITVILFLQFARSVFVPLALGVMINYALAPIVTWLQRWWIPRSVGALILLIAVIGAVALGIFLLSDDAVAVIEKIPVAAKKLRESVRAIRGDEESLIQKVQEAATEVENTTAEAAGADAVRKGVTRVQIEEKPIAVGAYLWWGGASVTAMVSEVILVLFLVYFMLISGDLFRRKMIKILGTSRLGRQITTEILDDIHDQISRYMFIQVFTSVCVGVVSAIAFRLVGLEQPLIWAIVVGLLDMIPYFGPLIAVAALFTIGFLQFGTMLMGLYLAGLTSAALALEGFVLTPWLTIRTMRMNGVVLMLGLMFWGWMWGFWGLLLAVPMMVIVKSISDRVEGLKPIGELIGGLNR